MFIGIRRCHVLKCRVIVYFDGNMSRLKVTKPEKRTECVCVLGVDEKVVKCKTENAQFSALNNAVRWILRIRTCGAKFLGG